MINNLLTWFWKGDMARCIRICLIVLLIVLLALSTYYGFPIMLIKLALVWDLLTLFWESGTWLGVSAFALLMLLIWFVMGANFKSRNKEVFVVATFALFAIFPIVWSLGIQPIQVKIALKSLLPNSDAVVVSQNAPAIANNQTQNLQVPIENNKPNHGGDVDLLRTVTPIVALFLTLFPFLIAKIFREHTAELRAEIKSASPIKIVALNSKCYSYFNRLLNDRSQHRQASRLQRIVEFFEVYFEDDDKLLLQLQEIQGTDDLRLLHRLSESKQYLNALKDYYADKNKESTNDTYKAIVSQCKRLLK